MDKILKISSEQSGEFSSTNNVVRFRVPADGQYDLVDSYIVLNMTATGEVSNANVVARIGGNAKSNFRFHYGVHNSVDGKSVSSNASFIKRIRVSSQKLGIIEEIQDVNLLSNMTKLYSDTLTAQTSKDYKSINSRMLEGMSVSPFRNFQGATQGVLNVAETALITSIPTTDKSFGCNIALSDLCSIGKLRNCPVDQMGELTIEVELLLDAWAARQIVAIPQLPSNTQQSSTDAQRAELNAFCDAFSNATGAAVNLGTDVPFVLQRVWNVGNLNTCPYYVGQPIQFNLPNAQGTGYATVVGAAAALETIQSSNSSIASMEWNPSTGKISITTSSVIGVAGLPNGQTFGASSAAVDATAIKISIPANATEPKLSVPTAQIVVKRVANPVQVSPKFNILTYETEVVTLSAIQSFRHQSRLPANCIGFLVMVPNGNTLLSSDTHLRNYRFAVNNIQLTNRPVITSVADALDSQNRSGLHFSLLEKGFSQIGIPLRNLSEVVGSQTESNMFYETGVIVMAGTCGITPDMKTLDLEINSGDASISKVVIYKAVIKPISL